MKKILCTAIFAVGAVLTGCSVGSTSETDITIGYSESSEAAVSEAEANEYTDSDIEAISFIMNYFADSEEFTDMTDYQYYARSLGLDKDYFLSPEMWEVYYSQSININKDIDGKEYYLIRINPYKLLEVYAQNADTDVDTLCKSLSVSSAQLYYNWGYNPNSYDYLSKHEKLTVTYSDEEKKIFGDYNGESRYDVMRTHMIVVDSVENTVTYSSDLPDSLVISRRDKLKAFTDVTPLYSKYTEAEKSSAYSINGIGIRTVIPITLPNAYSEAEGTDAEITVIVNESPFSYGCTDEDYIDIMPYVAEHTQSEE